MNINLQCTNYSTNLLVPKTFCHFYKYVILLTTVVKMADNPKREKDLIQRYPIVLLRPINCLGSYNPIGQNECTCSLQLEPSLGSLIDSIHSLISGVL